MAIVMVGVTVMKEGCKRELTSAASCILAASKV
jgi:hypothetical protein